MPKSVGFWLPMALAFAALASCVSHRAPQSGQAMVRVEQGVLEGRAENGLRVFKGIPFAASPAGENRWRPPQAAAAWEGARDASQFAAACVQPPLPESSIYYDPHQAVSEDCLNLNVWAPQTADNAPVIVWIHGGSLRIGAGSQPLYDGSAYARRGIVFVSINYRLGALGWFSHPELSAESDVGSSGNYGLLDQIEALRWVEDNIAEFGGDPANVTIMGESAGALSVTYLMASPLARGLFDKAIAQSTNLRTMPMLSQEAYGMLGAEQTGVNVARALNAPDLDALRTMDAQQLVNRAALSGHRPQGVIDGWSLQEQLIDTFDQRRQAMVPLLTGFMEGEMRAGLVPVPQLPAGPAEYIDEIERRYGDLAPEFLRLYPAADMRESMMATLRDAVFGWSSEYMTDRHSAAGQSAYLYYFDHCYPAARDAGVCAFHAGELPYTFGMANPNAPVSRHWPLPDSTQDTALADAMLDYWVSFARDGHPQSAGQPVWRPYGQDQSFMRFGQVPAAQSDLLQGMFELHQETVSRRREMGTAWFINTGVNSPILAD